MILGFEDFLFDFFTFFASKSTFPHLPMLNFIRNYSRE